MMGLGRMSGGGYSSSSNSNLSALAPPFTVERQSPNPYPPNPDLRFSTSSYGVQPYSQQWDNYVSPSAPLTEVQIDSTGINNQLSDDGYRCKDSVSQSSLNGHFSGAFPGSTSGGGYDYGAKVDPYYPPFVPSSVGEDGVSFWGEGSRRYVDGLGYVNNNQVEPDGDFLTLKLNDGGRLNQPFPGGGGTYGDKFREDSGCLYQHKKDVSSGEVTAGPFSAGNTEDDSRIWKLSGFIPCEPNGVNLAGSSSNYPQPCPSVPSFETPNSFSSYDSSFGSYENFHRTVDSPFTGLVSVARSSPAVVIRPPPAFDCNLPQADISDESDPKDDAAVSHRRNFDNSGSLWKKNYLLNLGCEMKEKPLEGKLISEKFCSSSSVEKNPSQLLAEDTLDGKIGGKSESRGCPSAYENNMLAIKSNEVIDYQNTAVDSPCWRGAPPSQLSLFDVEAAISNPVNKILKGNCAVYHEELGNLNSAVHTEAGVEVLNVSGNKGFQICDDLNISEKYSYLLNDLNIGPGIKTSSAEQFSDENNAGMTLNDVPEGGDVAVHAAEEVLSSPYPKEDTECNNTSDPKLDVPLMIKAICNLSELVLRHIAGDASSLDDESSDTLRRTICNLKACLSKQISQNSDETRADILVGDILGISGEPVYMTNLSGGHATHESENSHVQLGNNYLPDEKRNCHSAIKKDEKSPVVSLSLDDLDMPEADDVTKAIHRVLDEDFLIGEEMHPQALLYKNLWLESEAELCAISYRARFDRMRIRMGKMKADARQGSIEVEDCAQKMMPQADITAEKSTKPLNTSPITRGNADDVEASFMDRSNILKSHGENIETFITEIQQRGMIGSSLSGSILSQLGKRTNKEVEPQPKTADDPQSVMSRFHILKSREDSSKSDGAAERFQSKMIDDDGNNEQLKSREDTFKSDNAEGRYQTKTIDGEEEQVNPIMARYNILKSRGEGLNVNNMEKIEMGYGEYAGIVGSQSENRTTSNVVVEPYFSYPMGRDFGPTKEHTSSKADAILNPIVKGKTVNEDPARWPESSSSSSWEHIQKDEFSGNNY